MTMDCKTATPLIGGYLDGELSDDQAAPLRQHLMDCPGCRGAVSEAKNMRAWFVSDEAFEVPSGFAERVTRRALAGDTGQEEPFVLQPVQRQEAEQGPTGAAGAGEAEQGRLLNFVLQLTAIAAAVLFVVSLAMQSNTRPAGSELQAQDGSLGEALERLDALNEQADEEAGQQQADGEQE